MPRRLQRVLVANRGEIACRVMRSCRKLGLQTVAVYSDADAKALHVAAADQAFAIGPGPAKDSYLVAAKILESAKAGGADAVHPGYGFLAENARFAEAVQAAGLTWIGPGPKTIEDMGDKERARALAKAAGVPVLPGSARFAKDELAGLEEAAAAVGFPLLVKAAAGGGGIGMRRVDKPEDLAPVVAATQSMAEKSFGDGTIYLERLVARARHVEVQVFGFGDGHAVHFFERDCSLQRRYQKIIEESPAPGLSAKMLDAMCADAVRLARSERYAGAGTIEFVVDADNHDYYFLEMNTRIQVEHPVTEMITGADLVAMQIELAAGTLKPIDQSAIKRQGHAIECRLYAEDPPRNFMPSPGPLKEFTLPAAGTDLRIDTGFQQGDQISFFYDPMVAKLIGRGRDRNAAIAALRAGLDGVQVEGIKTNGNFLKACLEHPTFRAGDVHTGFVEAHKAQLNGGGSR